MSFTTTSVQRALAAVLALPILLIAANVRAETWRDQGVMLSPLNGAASLSSELQAGQQAAGLRLNGAVGFAGRTLTAQALDAVFGMSSDFAYLMVIEGTAVDGKKKIGPGRMLVIPAVGTKTRVERFDADLFKRSMAGTVSAEWSGLESSLTKIATRQGRAKWWGLLRPSGQNLNASRGIEHELNRRALVGNTTMQQIRFVGLDGESALARRTAEQFVGALHRQDGNAIEALLDPTQFGGLSLQGGAEAARQVAAQQLIARVKPATTQVAEGVELNRWQFDTAGGPRTLELRKIDDLFFVSSVF